MVELSLYAISNFRYAKWNCSFNAWMQWSFKKVPFPSGRILHWIINALQYLWFSLGGEVNFPIWNSILLRIHECIPCLEMFSRWLFFFSCKNKEERQNNLIFIINKLRKYFSSECSVAIQQLLWYQTVKPYLIPVCISSQPLPSLRCLLLTASTSAKLKYHNKSCNNQLFVWVFSGTWNTKLVTKLLYSIVLYK